MVEQSISLSEIDKILEERSLKIGNLKNLIRAILTAKIQKWHIDDPAGIHCYTSGFFICQE